MFIYTHVFSFASPDSKPAHLKEVLALISKALPLVGRYLLIPTKVLTSATLEWWSLVPRISYNKIPDSALKRPCSALSALHPVRVDTSAIPFQTSGLFCN